MLSEPQRRPSLDSLSSDGYSHIVRYVHAASLDTKNIEEDLVALVPLPTTKLPDGGLQAWLVVLGCWCTCFVSFGIANSFGVYETYFLHHFLQGHSPSTVAWIGSIQIFLLFFANIVSGPLLDRFGPAIVMWPASILLVISEVLVSVCTEYPQFLISQGVLTGLSAGFIFAPALSVIGHYFLKKRPLAIALASTGSPIGGVVYPVILTNLLPRVGFAWAQRTCALVTVVLLAIAAVLIRPAGVRRQAQLLIPQAFKIPAYSAQAVAMFLIMWGLFAPYFYLAEYALLQGMANDTAQYLFAIANAGSFVGRILAGVFAARLGVFNTLVIASYGASVTLFCWLSATSSAAIIVISLVFGAWSGIILALMFATVASTADSPNKIGTYIGQVTFIISFASLSGTPLTGALITRYQSFRPAIIFSSVSTMLGAIVLSMARYVFAKNTLIA